MTNELNCRQLSILIPAYNYVCTELVGELQRQAEVLGIDYEIIVADDGSPDRNTTECNKAIAGMPHCTYIIRPENVGRAVIRNFLSNQASFEWLLFLDCDIALPDSMFLSRYLKAIGHDVIDGGVCTDGSDTALAGNIRYIYERASESRHTATERANSPYRSFRTTNFMIRRDVMFANQFDKRFRFYGYEDVLFGKQLKACGCEILHIDNPVAIRDFEPNDVFIAKTEEGLRTLYRFKDDLAGYSHMLDSIERFRRVMPLSLIRLWHRIFGRWERRNLTGAKPWLKIFDIYRLGYYLSLTNKTLRQ